MLNGIGHYQNFLMEIQANFRLDDGAANFDFAEVRTFDLTNPKDGQ
jgi:hypothetical protein